MLIHQNHEGLWNDFSPIPQLQQCQSLEHYYSVAYFYRYLNLIFLHFFLFLILEVFHLYSEFFLLPYLGSPSSIFLITTVTGSYFIVSISYYFSYLTFFSISYIFSINTNNSNNFCSCSS